ncbi:hypothetical protein ACPCXD_16770 [Rhodococcus sp. AB351]|uniref:hypothetical protein n=1 Tax=Rhodococcus sp. AB351 TaxID=3413280 RepID=UPI003C1C6243
MTNSTVTATEVRNAAKTNNWDGITVTDLLVLIATGELHAEELSALIEAAA